MKQTPMQRNPHIPTDFKNTFLAQQQKKPRITTPDIPGELYTHTTSHHYFDTSTGLPPLSTAYFTVTETLNSDPSILKASMYSVPTTNYVLEQIGLPLGIVFQPLSSRAYPSKSGFKVQCVQCGAYFNPHCEVVNNFFKCNLCNTTSTFNTIEEENQVNFQGDKNYLNGDSSSFAHLKKNGTIEYLESTDEVQKIDTEIVNDELYLNYPKKNPVFIFCFEHSSSTNSSLFLEAVRTVESVVTDSEFRYEHAIFLVYGKFVSIFKLEKGIVHEVRLFDDEVNVINCSVDIKSVTKLHSNSAINGNGTENNSSPLRDLFDKIRETKASSELIDLNSIIRILEKISIFFKGAKSLFFIGSDSQAISKGDLNINVITAARSSKLVDLCYSSNGVLISYEKSKIFEDVYTLATEKSVFNALVRVKNSDCLGKRAVYVNGDSSNTNCVRMAQIKEDTAISYIFFIDENIKNAQSIYIQAICRFTEIDGTVKSIVANLSLCGSSTSADIYSNLCVDVLYSLICKETVGENYKKNIEKVDLAPCLAFYRSKVCKDASPIHLHLPETIKLLPGLCQSISKNRIFNDCIDLALHNCVLGMSIIKTFRFFYPRLISLSDFFVDKNISKLRAIRLSSSFIDPGEVYVLENGLKIIVYFGEKVEIDLKTALLSDTEERDVLDLLIEQIRCEYVCNMDVIMIEQGKGRDIEFNAMMLEDELYSFPAYEEYVCDLHLKVKKH